MKEKTLSIIKPDVLKNKKIGQVIDRFEKSGLKIIDMKMMYLTKAQAAKFYEVHSSKAFFSDLVEFMSSGPIIVQILEGENAIKRNRELMGHTNPKMSNPGTIRYEFASSIDENAVHGSDSPETAHSEIKFFFG